MNSEIFLDKSTRKNKKLSAKIENKTIHFGQTGFSDYTLHKDDKRKEAYISRHKKREDWTIKGIKTAGFWSRWILWNKPTINESIRDTERRFDIEIIKRPF